MKQGMHETCLHRILTALASLKLSEVAFHLLSTAITVCLRGPSATASCCLLRCLLAPPAAPALLVVLMLHDGTKSAVSINKASLVVIATHSGPSSEVRAAPCTVRSGPHHVRCCGVLGVWQNVNIMFLPQMCTLQGVTFEVNTHL